MKLTIIDTEKATTHDVSWVEFNTSVGNMVIQPEHAPMVIELLPEHELVFELVTGAVVSMMIAQAVAHVARSEVKVLIPLVV